MNAIVPYATMVDIDFFTKFIKRYIRLYAQACIGVRDSLVG